jgi:hypothetical protein
MHDPHLTSKALSPLVVTHVPARAIKDENLKVELGPMTRRMCVHDSRCLQ